MAMSLDPSLYIVAPNFNRTSGIALGKALAAAAPAEMSPRTRKAFDRLTTMTGRLQQMVISRQQEEAVGGTASVTWDRAVDAAVAALKKRLDAYAVLPAVRYPRAPRAAELVATLFPGLTFLNLPFAEEWAVVETLLKRVDDEGLASTIDELAGAEFLAELRYVHGQYGEALGKTKPLASSSVDLHAALRDLAEAITGYALQVLAMADTDEPTSVAAVQAALRPIDEHRADAARRRGPRGTKDDAAAESA